MAWRGSEQKIIEAQAGVWTVEALAVLTILNLESCPYQLPPGLVKTAVFLSPMR